MRKPHPPRSSSPQHCDAADLAAAYALGGLPASELSAAEAHIASCLECRREIDSLRPVIARFAFWPTDVVRPAAALKAQLAERIVGDAAATPAARVASRCAEPEWEQVAPGVECKLLATDPGRQRISLLVRLAAGASYRPHTHADGEELHLLDGELWIDGRALCPGGCNDRARGGADRRAWTNTGCTCVLITSTRDLLDG